MPPKKQKKQSELNEDLIAECSELSEDGRAIVCLIFKKIESFKSEWLQTLAERDSQINSLQDEVSALKNTISGMEKQFDDVQTLRNTVSKLEERIDDADAYERRDTLLFSGSDIPAATTGENCGQLICSVVEEKLKLSISASVISIAHRVGKMPITQGPDRRSIVVKLCRREIKRDILDACRKFKPTGLFVNESLTPVRSTIMYILRKAKREFPNKISGSNSVDGKVFVWVHPPNPNAPNARNSRMSVNTHLKLAQFCSNILDTPLSTFMETWPH